MEQNKICIDEFFVTILLNGMVSKADRLLIKLLIYQKCIFIQKEMLYISWMETDDVKSSLQTRLKDFIYNLERSWENNLSNWNFKVVFQAQSLIALYIYIWK